MRLATVPCYGRKYSLDGITLLRATVPSAVCNCMCVLTRSTCNRPVQPFPATVSLLIDTVPCHGSYNGFILPCQFILQRCMGQLHLQRQDFRSGGVVAMEKPLGVTSRHRTGILSPCHDPRRRIQSRRIQTGDRGVVARRSLSRAGSLRRTCRAMGTARQ